MTTNQANSNETQKPQRTVSNRTAEMMAELQAVLTRKPVKPAEMIEIGKLIEKGEKAVRKEHRKLSEIIEQVTFELQEIEKFAVTMGYAILDEIAESEGEPEQEAAPAEESTEEAK